MDSNPHVGLELRLFSGTEVDRLFSMLRFSERHGLSRFAETNACMLLECEHVNMSDVLYILYRVDGCRRQAGEWILQHDPTVSDLTFVLVELYEDHRDLACRAWSKMARMGAVLRNFSRFQDSSDYREEIRRELREVFEEGLE